MKRWTQKPAGVLSAALVIIATACVAMRLPEVTAQNAALAAAGFIMPSGAAQAVQSIIWEKDEEDGGISSSGSKSAASSTAPSAPGTASSGSKPTNSETSQSSENPVSGSSSSGLESASSGLSPSIKEMSIANTGIQYNNIWVKNTNKIHSVNVADELSKQPAIKIVKNSTPQVLIYHTHTTEAFMGVTRSTDLSKSVVAVGNEIANQLKAAGINVIHDTTLHDYPSYNGSYDRSKVTMQNDLKKYPGIQVTLDIHRDAMGTSDGTRIKPTAVIDGKKAAQIMIVSGCDDTGSLGFPNWEYNLRLAVRLQRSLSDLYPGLARPLDFCNREYNEKLTKGSLLVEFGTEVNTLDEATYSGALFGKALAAELNKLT